MKIKLKLLILLFIRVISFKYWWNYDCSRRWIYVYGTSESAKLYHVLNFHEHLKLVCEDLYMITDTDNEFVNKYIQDPIHKQLYTYDYLTSLFEPVPENLLSKTLNIYNP